MKQKGLSILIVLLMLGMLGVWGRKADKNSLLINQAKMYEAYHDLLMNLHDNEELWERPKNNSPEWIDIEENQFAVCDADFDGKDELILVYDPGWTAGMLEIIYDYNYKEKMIREQEVFFPGAVFYDNGVIFDMASHNQGVAGRFWPFRLCKYNHRTDCYEVVASIDAWDKEYAPVNNYTGEEFPDDVDKDGNGLIYYIYDVYIDEAGNVCDIHNDAAMDDIDYRERMSAFMGDAKELEIPFVNLTTENIDKIKY